MRKRFLFALLAAAALVLCGCDKDEKAPEEPETPTEEPPGPEEPPVDPADLDPLSFSVAVTQDWIYSGKPEFTVHVSNPNGAIVPFEIKCRIVEDKGPEAAVIEFTAEATPMGEQDFVLTTDEPLEPGFYRARFTSKNKFIRAFVFGIDPTQIVSAPDMQADFNEFWETALTQLEAVDMDPKLTEVTAKSSSDAKVYLVEFNSIPDGLTGEPVKIHGYYVEPTDGAKHPVLMHYYGYDDAHPTSKVYCPSGGTKPLFAEFYVPTRGQVINNRPANLREDGVDEDYVNEYGDWFAFHFGDRDSYYYRGAFMDVVQGIRFMATRETSDMSNVFAEGKSQGGALSYAAAALSPYPLSAIAPGVAFLGDFPDYFQIVGWPANTAKANQGTMTDAEMYAFLSYFDTKNLATRISCPIIANLGLQDGTCPPHTNMAPFNNALSTEKEMHYYPQMGHEIPKDWESKITTFFKTHIPK